MASGISAPHLSVTDKEGSMRDKMKSPYYCIIVRSNTSI